MSPPALRPGGGRDVWGSKPARLPRLFGNSWVAALALAMLLASNYRIRIRKPQDSLAGRPDLVILVEIAAYGLVAAFLVFQLARPPRDRRVGTLTFVMWLFVGIMALSVIDGVYRLLAVVLAAQLAILAAVAHAIARHGTRRQLHRFAQAFVALVTVSIFIGAARPFPKPPTQKARFNWLHVHAVVAGVFLAVAVVILVAYLVKNGTGPRSRPWPRVFLLGLLALNSAALLATKTRGAIGGAVVGVVVVLVMAAPPKRRGDLVVISGLAVALVAMLFSDQIVDYLLRGEGVQRLASFNNRTKLWEEAVNRVSDRPFLGYGIGATKGLFLTTVGLGGGHNAFINVLTDAGWLGAATWMALLAVLADRLFRATQQARPNDGPMLLGILACLVVDAVTYEGLATPNNVAGLWLFVLVGWAGVLEREGRRLDRARGAVPAAAPAGDGGPLPGRPVPVVPADGRGARGHVRSRP